jgi:hypothetical protein
MNASLRAMAAFKPMGSRPSPDEESLAMIGETTPLVMRKSKKYEDWDSNPGPIG